MSADDGDASAKSAIPKRKKKKARKKKAPVAKRTRAEKPRPRVRDGFLDVVLDALSAGSLSRLEAMTRVGVIALVIVAAIAGGVLGGSLDAALALALAAALVGMLVFAVAQIIAAEPLRSNTRPSFARDWPRDERLDALIAAFEAGNFARVRSEAPALAKTSDDEAIKAAAFELRRRIEPGPGALYLWALGVMLVVFLYSYFHAH